MYRSPIEIVMRPIIQHQIAKEQDEQIYKAVVSVGINVDKDELIRALQYDRNQYREGYNDGYRDGKESAMEDIAFPRFLVRPPEPSKEELEAILHSPTTIITNKESITSIYPYSRWIPVTERLPKVRQRILVYCESKTIEKHITACTYMGGIYGRPQFSRHCRNVTHWMPLPQPPKGE